MWETLLKLSKSFAILAVLNNEEYFSYSLETWYIYITLFDSCVFYYVFVVFVSLMVFSLQLASGLLSKHVNNWTEIFFRY